MQTRFPSTAGIAIGPILFVVAILAVLVGAIAAGSGGFGGSTANEGARIRAGTIIQQGITLKDAITRIVSNGSDPSAVVVAESGFTATSYVALYGVSGGGITVQNPPSEAVVSGASWRFASTANLPSMGAAGTNDTIAALQVTLPVCNALNDIIFGKGIYSAPPSMGTSPTVTLNTVAAGNTVIPADNAFTLDSDASVAFASRNAACAANGTDYYYYQLLIPG